MHNTLFTSVLLITPRLLNCKASLNTFSGNMTSASSGTKTSKDDCYVAMVTCPNVDTAKLLSRGLVERKLAACVNVVPLITSIYEWNGKIEEDNESLMIIKTVTSKIDEVNSYVEKNHPYDVPEVIAMKIEQGSKSYLDWIRQVTLRHQ